MIISIVISFFGCIYNEFVVLSFCGLELESHYAISRRASDNDIDRIYSINDLDITSDMEED